MEVVLVFVRVHNQLPFAQVISSVKSVSLSDKVDNWVISGGCTQIFWDKKNALGPAVLWVDECDPFSIFPPFQRAALQSNVYL